MTRRRTLLLLFRGLAAFAAVVSVLFRADLRAARAALDDYETVAVASSVGLVETVDSGDGFPVLSIHGTGGGYDQGYALAAGLLDRGYRVIATSRGSPGIRGGADAEDLNNRFVSGTHCAAPGRATRRAAP